MRRLLFATIAVVVILVIIPTLLVVLDRHNGQVDHTPITATP
jgi:hypothetical protein